MDSQVKRGGWRWLQIRREAITQAALANLHLDEACLAVENPKADNFVPVGTCEWSEIRSRAVQKAAISVLKDRNADTDDRWCSASARRALERPAEDVALALMYETGLADAPYAYMEGFLAGLLDE